MWLITDDDYMGVYYIIHSTFYMFDINKNVKKKKKKEINLPNRYR